MSSMSDLRGEMEIFSGSAHPQLARDIAEWLGGSLSKLTISRFPDREIYVRIDTNVRGKDVFVVQPTCPPANEYFTELLIIMDALRRASAARITLVIPYYGYARQDKKTAGREPITARMVADMLIRGGADRILTVDLHSPQIQGFFDIPVDHLTATGILSNHMKLWDLSGGVIVAPDAGRVNMATEYANRLGLPVAIIHKRRVSSEMTKAVFVVGDVEGKHPIIIDDMITTGGTMDRSIDALLSEGCVPHIRIAATHAILVGKALEVLGRSEVETIVLTDTIPLSSDNILPKTRIVSVATLIAEAIKNIHADESVSKLFSGNGNPY